MAASAEYEITKGACPVSPAPVEDASTELEVLRKRLALLESHKNMAAAKRQKFIAEMHQDLVGRNGEREGTYYYSHYYDSTPGTATSPFCTNSQQPSSSSRQRARTRRRASLDLPACKDEGGCINSGDSFKVHHPGLPSSAFARVQAAQEVPQCITTARSSRRASFSGPVGATYSSATSNLATSSCYPPTSPCCPAPEAPPRNPFTVTSGSNNSSPCHVDISCRVPAFSASRGLGDPCIKDASTMPQVRYDVLTSRQSFNSRRASFSALSSQSAHHGYTSASQVNTPWHAAASGSRSVSCGSRATVSDAPHSQGCHARRTRRLSFDIDRMSAEYYSTASASSSRRKPASPASAVRNSPYQSSQVSPFQVSPINAAEQDSRLFGSALLQPSTVNKADGADCSQLSDDGASLDEDLPKQKSPVGQQRGHILLGNDPKSVDMEGLGSFQKSNTQDAPALESPGLWPPVRNRPAQVPFTTGTTAVRGPLNGAPGAHHVNAKVSFSNKVLQIRDHGDSCTEDAETSDASNDADFLFNNARNLPSGRGDQSSQGPILSQDRATK